MELLYNNKLREIDLQQKLQIGISWINQFL
jgi:hypothetical protein